MTDSPFRTAGGIEVPAVTADEMRAVDRVAVEDVGVELLQMMENAGRTLAWHVRDISRGPVLVIAGGGGNGGGGLACARHLANRDQLVEVVLDRAPEELGNAAFQQFSVLAEMSVPVEWEVDLLDRRREYDVVVDALIGYGLRGEVREPARTFIESVGELSASVVSLDVPSGFDGTDNNVLGPSIVPDRTVTLALPKTALADRPESLYLADIGIPPTVFDRLDIDYENPFGTKPWVELQSGNETVTR